MQTLTRSISTSNIKKNNFLGSTILSNTQKISTNPIPISHSRSNSQVKLPHKPTHQRDLRNEVPIKNLLFRNENQITIAKNFEKKQEDENNFASYFFMNSNKRYDKDYTQEVRQKLIDEYHKEKPDAYV